MSKDEDFKLGAACTVVLGVIVVVLFCMNPVAGSGLAILLAIVWVPFYLLSGWLWIEIENRKRAKRGLPPKKPSEFDTRDPGSW